MSYTILDDGTNVYENPDKGSAVLMQTKANETVSFLALAHGGFYKIRVNGVDGYVLCDKVVDTILQHRHRQKIRKGYVHCKCE